MDVVDPRAPTRPSALVLAGGPEFHQPAAVAARLAGLLEGPAGVRTEVTDDLDVLADADRLADLDLLVLLWTGGTLSPDQEAGLEAAVVAGTGVAAVHGAAAAFRGSARYQAVVGGQFVDHPGGEDVTYSVDVRPGSALGAGLESFSITTEQYYLHVDPAVQVVATTTFSGDRGPLLAGGPVTVPVAWTRHHGRGRVAYCALGHRPEVFDVAGAAALTSRCLRWAGSVPPARGVTDAPGLRP